MKPNQERLFKIGIWALAAIMILMILLNAWRKLKTPAASEQGSGGSIEAEASDGLWVEEEELLANPDVTLSIKEAVLGHAQQEKKLVVFRQNLSDIIKVTDKGKLPFNLSAKYQYIKYSGTATYTVDLSGIDADHLRVDEEAKTITILIPHAEETLDINEDETQADDTEKIGIFSIGDLKQSEEERAEVIADVKRNMENKLKQENVVEIADRMANLSVWEIYQPVVSGVAPDYTVEVEFS